MTPQNDAVGEPNLQHASSACVDQLRSMKAHVGVDSGGEDSDSSSGSKNALYYLERLRVLQKQAGLDPSAVLLDSKQQGPCDKDDNAANDENLNKKPALDAGPEGVGFMNLCSMFAMSCIYTVRSLPSVSLGDSRFKH
jgi:hypothetical protein